MLGERPPLADYMITHSMCDTCHGEVDAEADLPPAHTARVTFYRALFTAAYKGDRQACRDLAAEGLALGVAPGDLLVGLVQPLLVEVGDRWERGLITVADEHRMSHWCAEMCAALPVPSQSEGPTALLLVPARGNDHVLGLRIAEYALRDLGFRCEAFVPNLPSEEIASLAQTTRARCIGFSCARQVDVDAALEQLRELRQLGCMAPIVFSGQAFRRGPETAVNDVTVVRTVEETANFLAKLG